jgi:putative SOS response-associated peptidase YedK
VCGRFVSSSPPDELARYFGAAPSAEAAPVADGQDRFEPNFNVAPSTDVLAVSEGRDGRRLRSLHWGLVPGWAKDVSVGYKLINARAEGVARSGAFRRPFTHRRCLIPADGFYEWSKVPGHRRKQPYFVHRVDDEPLAFAGLWEVWRGPRSTGDGDVGVGGSGTGRREGTADPVRSCSIITTGANALMAPVHDRMPVILPPSAWDAWLDPDNHDTEALERLLVPAPEGLLALHPVSMLVSDVRNQGPQLLEPVDSIDPDGVAASGQGRLLDLDS